MKILILGSKGQIGVCLKNIFKYSSHDVYAFSKKDLDISDLKKLRRKIITIRPNLIINAAAFTDVDGSEQNRTEANKANNIAVKDLAILSKELDIFLFHFSTDYVFNGISKLPFKETDTTGPINFYGQTKLDGENEIIKSGCNYIIIRTSWVFSCHGNNFFKTMYKLAQNNDYIKIINDQIGCPTSAEDIAYTVKKIIDHKNFMKNTKEIFHYCGDISCSWYEFAKIIFNEMKRKDLSVPLKAIPIKSNDYKTLASRPLYSVLDCTKIHDHFDVYKSDWKCAIRKFVDIKSKDNLEKR